MKRITLILLVMSLLGTIGITYANTHSIGIMMGGIPAAKKFYTKEEACTLLKDNRYDDPEIAITWTNSAAKGYILFKKKDVVFYKVEDYIDKQGVNSYLYSYNCKSKKASQLLNPDSLYKLLNSQLRDVNVVSILGYDKGVFLLNPSVDGIGCVGICFSKYVVRNSNTKKSSNLDVASYANISKIKNFDIVFAKHVEAIQNQVKGQQSKDIVSPTCEFGGPCTFDQSRGDLLLKKWDSKNNQKIFINSITGEPRGIEWGGLSVKNTRGLTSTVSFNYTVWVKEIGTPVETTVSYNWLTNTFDKNTTKTVRKKTVVVHEDGFIEEKK